MNAILLSAGFGKRLLPFTKTKPKCLINIYKKENLLELWLEKLHKLNVKKVVINTHYKKDLISSYLKKSKYKKKIEISYEKKILGTAGTLIKHKKLLKNDDLILVHSDNYCEENLELFLKAHINRPKNCLMTMLTFRTKKPENCGIVKVDKNNIVKEFFEKKKIKKGNLANGAIYILSKEIYPELTKKKYLDFSNEVIPRYINKILTYETNSYFIDIGTPQSLKKIRKYLYEKNT
tara:strand:- start:25 stop:729 length:705 start_codon:yes stop_codon:yes gene_type:complete